MKYIMLFLQMTDILSEVGLGADVIQGFSEEKVRMVPSNGESLPNHTAGKHFSLNTCTCTLPLLHAWCCCRFILKLCTFSVQVYPPTVILLSDEQLQELGVLSMGERASLRALCKRVECCKYQA